MRASFFYRLAAVAFVISLSLFSSVSEAQKNPRKKVRVGKICFDPTKPCRTVSMFQPYELPFIVPENATVSGSEPFFAVILKSVKIGETDCERFIPEPERFEAQKLFPNRKVFASRSCGETGSVYYTDTPLNVEFMAVYGGATQAEAMQTLAAAKATGKYSKAYLKKMRADFNGT